MIMYIGGCLCDWFLYVILGTFSFRFVSFRSFVMEMVQPKRKYFLRKVTKKTAASAEASQPAPLPPTKTSAAAWKDMAK